MPPGERFDAVRRARVQLPEMGEKSQPVFSDHDRDQLRLDRESGFSEGQISAGREAQAEATPPVARVPGGDEDPPRKGGVEPAPVTADSKLP